MTAMIGPTVRADLERRLRAVCFDAKREMPKVGTAEYPTEWDVAHSYLDELLSEWEAAR